LEELFGMERILGANEVFITNSLMEIMPVSRIDGHTVGKPTPDTITKLLHHKYKSLKI